MRRDLGKHRRGVVGGDEGRDEAAYIEDQPGVLPGPSRVQAGPVPRVRRPPDPAAATKDAELDAAYGLDVGVADALRAPRKVVAANPQLFAGDDGVRLMFSVAFLRETRDAPVSTDALLVGAASSSAAGSLFDSVELTPSVVRFVSRHRRGHWVSDDAAGVGPSGPHQLVMVPGGEPAPFTPAAAEAMRRAADTARLSGRATSSPVDVALSLLSDHANRAVEMVACCGLEVALLERVLESGEPSVAPSVDPGLRRARDVLLGRTQYSRRPGWRGLLTWSALPGRSSYAVQPTLWAWLEARALAVADGRDEPGTHDLLLAVLAIHEVGTRYPHLSGSAADLYAGARMLATQLATQLSATAGIGYAEAAATARRTDLGVDPRPLRAYVRSLPADTAALLGLVLQDHDTRAARLLLALGVDVTQLPVA